jgi:hypothetical protein
MQIVFDLAVQIPGRPDPARSRSYWIARDDWTAVPTKGDRLVLGSNIPVYATVNEVAWDVLLGSVTVMASVALGIEALAELLSTGWQRHQVPG